MNKQGGQEGMIRILKACSLSLFLPFMVFGVQKQADDLELRISYTGSKNSPITIKTHYCKGTTLKCGVQTKTAPNGVVIFRANYVNDKYDGLVRSYYANGNLKESREYIEGKETNTRTLYYENGKIQLTQAYEQNKREGEGKKYYESGKLKEQFFYKNDMREGIRQEFDKYESLVYETFYKQGRKQWVKQYDTKGNVINETSCRWNPCY